MISIGRIADIVRYPVKSMAGVPADSAFLGFHGIAGDRRFAVRRVGDESGFPWLQASRLPQLLRYLPILDDNVDDPSPTHVRTPDGATLVIRGDELKSEIGERLGSAVELMKFRQGIFDEAAISVISLATIAGIGAEAGVDLDRRRFRANVFLETDSSEAFLEDAWVGGTLVFGEKDPRPAVSVTLRDERCVMINLDPDTAEQDPRVMKTVVRLNKNNAGVYATVVRTGVIRVGDRVQLVPSETRG